MKAKNGLLCIMTILIAGIGMAFFGKETAHTVQAADDQTAAQKQLESTMGKMVLAEWTRVRSADDLRQCTSWTPMRLYYDYHTLCDLLESDASQNPADYDFYNKAYLILQDSGDNSSQPRITREEVSPYIYSDSDFAELYAAGQGRNGYLLYSGKDDSDNDNMPLCTISIDPGRNTYLGINSDKKLDTKATWQDNWTVYPQYNGNENIVKLFVNLKRASDPVLRVNFEDENTISLYTNTKGYLSDYPEFTMYLGKMTDVTVIQKDLTVGEGQTVRINRQGAVALQAGTTLTIEEGGAAIIQSRFLNQGTIINKGTLIVMDGGSFQPLYDPGAGSIRCDGGDIVILSGGRFMSSEALTLQNGSSIVNGGIFLVKKSLTLDNSSLITEEGALTLLGYDIKPEGFSSAKKTTVYDNATAKSVPALSGSSLYSVNSGSLNLKNTARVISRGETSIHQTIVSGNGSAIRQESGQLYKWN